MTVDQLDQILERLGSDDQFRERMLGNPVAALAEHGVNVDPSTVPHVRTLPSKDAIKSQRAALMTKVDGRAQLFLFLLNA
ncbi:NHLP-related RiPP peptide [Dokdonella soli]|uniref:NHLP leader peptide family natural product n=1 Tax=Dokdonella soli TaxID=529810 RepID=A0ABN1IFH9_9GAMM